MGFRSSADAAVSLASACGGADSGSGSDAKTPTKKDLTVAFLPKQVSNNDYFTTADNGGKKALGTLGSAYKEVGTESGSDVAGQVSHVDALIQEQVDAIAVSARDPDALCTSLKQAMSDGISVVTYDSDTNKECRQVFVSPASAEDIGRSQVGLLMQQLDSEDGEIAILSAARTASNQNLWIDYMKDELNKYLGIKIVEIAYGDDDPKKSAELTESLLKKHPNLKAIISPTTVGIKAAAKYLSESEYKGKVKLTGLGTPNEMRPYIKDETVDSFILWDPAEVGALAAHAAIALESGQITGKDIDALPGQSGRDPLLNDLVVKQGPFQLKGVLRRHRHRLFTYVHVAPPPRATNQQRTALPGPAFTTMSLSGRNQPGQLTGIATPTTSPPPAYLRDPPERQRPFLLRPTRAP